MYTVILSVSVSVYGEGGGKEMGLEALTTQSICVTAMLRILTTQSICVTAMLTTESQSGSSTLVNSPTTEIE